MASFQSLASMSHSSPPRASLWRWRRRRSVLLPLLLLFAAGVAGHGSAHDAACPFSTPASSLDQQHHGHHHHHDDHDNHHHDHHHHHGHKGHEVHDHHREIGRPKLPEELVEEEDLAIENSVFHHHHDHHDHRYHFELELSPLGLWMQAMACSMLVSMASLVCLTIVPVFFFQGKPSKVLVDSLAIFGAGAMLGDAFLHQLPHAFGGDHTHSVDNHSNGGHVDNTDHGHSHSHSHSHSLKDLSVGLSILSGIVFFLIVEKFVRYVENISGDKVHGFQHGHHHKQHKKLKNDDDDHSVDKLDGNAINTCGTVDKVAETKHLDDQDDDVLIVGKRNEHESHLNKRAVKNLVSGDDTSHNDSRNVKPVPSDTPSAASPSSLVIGYLNLFSDGVHNFTDGMALGSAFMLHGSVGGWSRTLFLLAHELPQEVGDFGILVRSGFSVSKALFFNFLSALVALAGTALALSLGHDPGHSSLIEGFTAGGFIYIAVSGVIPEMNSGEITFKGTATQLVALMLGISVALCISLVE